MHLIHRSTILGLAPRPAALVAMALAFGLRLHAAAGGSLPPAPLASARPSCSVMPEQNKPREVIIHQSANRPNQILGGDRELVLIAMLTAISLAFSLGSWWGIGLSVAFWVGAVAILQRMGKADPLLRQIYVRHIRYKAFYPAKSGLLSRCIPIPRNWR